MNLKILEFRSEEFLPTQTIRSCFLFSCADNYYFLPFAMFKLQTLFHTIIPASFFLFCFVYYASAHGFGQSQYQDLMEQISRAKWLTGRSFQEVLPIEQVVTVPGGQLTSAQKNRGSLLRFTGSRVVFITPYQPPFSTLALLAKQTQKHCFCKLKASSFTSPIPQSKILKASWKSIDGSYQRASFPASLISRGIHAEPRT